MMAALIAGGMNAAWSKERDQLAASYADGSYHPNKAGLYEVQLSEYGLVDFPLQYQGKLIKVMSWGLDGLAVNPQGYRVVLMHRNTEEIRQSYEAFFSTPFRGDWLEQYEQRTRREIAILQNRNDVLSVDVVQYRQLINDPVAELNSLLVNNWPIDVAKAATAIDSKQYRFRRELLTPGI